MTADHINRPWTDLGNAERFRDDHAAEVRFLTSRKAWMNWDGARWKIDETGEVYRRAGITARNILREAADLPEADERRPKLVAHALRTESRSRLEAMVKLAESREPLPVLIGDLDRDPYLFNVKNGTINLKTGELRPHNKADLITRLSPVKYNPEALCPTWDGFLRRIFADSEELIGFIQRAIGYSLTGDTSEHVMLLCYGTGANGKSVLLEVLRTMYGDYARNAEASTFLAKQSDQVRNDLAALAGARLVTASETENGRRLAESFVKSVTGGDVVTARFLYAEYFEFRPQFKLWVGSNYKPSVRGVDDGIWRRLRLIPFGVTIPERERDRNLTAKLRTELPGILAWAVRGCLEWQRDGLGTAPEVTAATRAYRDEQDPIGAFVAEQCVEHETAQQTTGELYAAYAAWAEKAGEHPIGVKAFANCLTMRGHTGTKVARQRGWKGIGLVVGQMGQMGRSFPEPLSRRGDQEDLPETTVPIRPNRPSEVQ